MSTLRPSLKSCRLGGKCGETQHSAKSNHFVIANLRCFTLISKSWYSYLKEETLWDLTSFLQLRSRVCPVVESKGSLISSMGFQNRPSSANQNRKSNTKSSFAVISHRCWVQTQMQTTLIVSKDSVGILAFCALRFESCSKTAIYIYIYCPPLNLNNVLNQNLSKNIKDRKSYLPKVIL